MSNMSRCSVKRNHSTSTWFSLAATMKALAPSYTDPGVTGNAPVRHRGTAATDTILYAYPRVVVPHLRAMLNQEADGVDSPSLGSGGQGCAPVLSVRQTRWANRLRHSLPSSSNNPVDSHRILAADDMLRNPLQHLLQRNRTLRHHSGHHFIHSCRGLLHKRETR